MMKSYENRCYKALKSMNAPPDNWECVEMIDNEELTTCELCGCSKVRFIHEMTHEDFEKHLHVGCCCAGLLEGDELKAEERERKLRNRLSRLKTFMKQEWQKDDKGLYLNYKGNRLHICDSYYVFGTYFVRVNKELVSTYKGKPIRSIEEAKRIIFDMYDK